MTLFSAIHTLTGPPRRLVIVRHGETWDNAAGVWQGQLDSPLSDRGRAQATAMAPLVAALAPQRIVSSDLSRARDTAAAISWATGIPVALDPRLREIHAGQWQGLTSQQVKERDPELRAAVLAGEDLRRGHTGENLAEVLARCSEAVGEIVAELAPGECAVLVTHGVAGRCIASAVLDLDLDLAWRVLGGFGNCHWSEVVEGARGWRLTSWNVGAPAGDVAGADA